MSATKTIEIEYALDNSDVWTSVATLDEDGQPVFDLAPSPNTDDLSGILFRNIRFRITSASDTAEESPDLHNLSLEFLKELDEQWQFRFSVDLNKTYNGLTPDEMREKLLESQNKRHLVPFTYRNKGRRQREVPRQHAASPVPGVRGRRRRVQCERPDRPGRVHRAGRVLMWSEPPISQHPAGWGHSPSCLSRESLSAGAWFRA